MLQEIRRLARNIAVMINRNVFERVTKAGTKNQLWLVRGLHDQDKEVEVFEPFGLTSSPPDDAELLRFALDGHEEHSIALGATGGSKRPRNLAPGEVRLYGNGNATIQILDDRIVFVVGGNTITMTAGGLVSNQDATFNGVSVATHTHDGVSTGLSNTGQPN